MNILEDKDISLRAKGLYCMAVTLSQDKLNIKTLQSLSSNGRDSTRAAMQELIDKGYLEKQRVRGVNGCFNTVKWIVVHGEELEDAYRTGFHQGYVSAIKDPTRLEEIKEWRYNDDYENRIAPPASFMEGTTLSKL